LRPAAPRYITSGRGMALALRHADEVNGYTLSDEATFMQLAPELELEMLYGGDERLLNTYSVIYPRDDAAASRFGEWLVAGAGRAMIERFTVAGKRVFAVAPPVH
jgi:tungstate transport system substrate-binding protein